MGGVMSPIYCILHDIPTPTKDSSNPGGHCPTKEWTTKEYIECFNKEVVKVWGISERMKMYHSKEVSEKEATSTGQSKSNSHEISMISWIMLKPT